MATKLRIIFATVIVVAAFVAINSWAAAKHDAAGLSLPKTLSMTRGSAANQNMIAA